MPPKRAAAARADEVRFWDVFFDYRFESPETSVSHTFTHVTTQCRVRNSFAVMVFCDSLETSSCFILSQNLSLYLMYCCICTIVYTYIYIYIIYIYIYVCVHTKIKSDIIWYTLTVFLVSLIFFLILLNAFHPSRLVQRSALRPKHLSLSHLQSKVPCRSHLPAPRLPLSPAVDGQVAKVEKWAAEITRPRLKWPQHRIWRLETLKLDWSPKLYWGGQDMVDVDGIYIYCYIMLYTFI